MIGAGRAQRAQQAIGTGWSGFGTPVGRGFALITIAAAATGFAMAAQQNVVSNYFEHNLGLGGPEFGYITAIREVPGFLLIFLTAMFYRLSLPHLTAGALLVLAVGYGFYGFSSSFWTVTPWVVLSSMGYHTWMQTRPALGMSLTTESKSGEILGRISAIYQGGSLLAMVFVFLAFRHDVIGYRGTFAICGVMALLAAVAIVRFPHLQDGQVQAQRLKRERMVFRREYRLFYLLNLLDGARQQIFFSFGLWVLVDHFEMGVPAISAVMLVVAFCSMVLGPWIGRQIDLRGEKDMLAVVNVAYVVALFGYGLIDQVGFALACYVIYSFIFPFSSMGASIYLRKIAPSADVAPSFAMGVTMQHAAAIVVPVMTGFVLNYVGYQIPFLIAGLFAVVTLVVTRQLDAANQKSPRRLREEAMLAAD